MAVASNEARPSEVGSFCREFAARTAGQLTSHCTRMNNVKIESLSLLINASSDVQHASRSLCPLLVSLSIGVK